MSETPIKIAISGKVAYEDQITIAQAAQIIAFLNSPDSAQSALGAGAGAGPAGGGLAPPASGRHGDHAVASAREALDLSGAKTNPEKIVALGAYVLQDGGETFKVEDVKTQFRRARETAPANFSRDLAVAVQAGWLAEADSHEYYLTNKIQGIFGGDFKFPKSATASRTSRSARGGKASKPEVFADIDEFPTHMDGIAPYSKMKTDKDRMLWALRFAKNAGIKGLANKELTWLTDHLGRGVPSGNITANFNRAKSQGHMIRSTVDQSLRITDGGDVYLSSVGTAES